MPLENSLVFQDRVLLFLTHLRSIENVFMVKQMSVEHNTDGVDGCPRSLSVSASHKPGHNYVRNLYPFYCDEIKSRIRYHRVFRCINHRQATKTSVMTAAV